MLASDNELLGRYLFGDDSTAFEEIVRRHSSLVMNVCRTMLLSREDAEDAFQATFLVLSKKARSLVNRNSIAPWLYHVAVRNCLETRRLHSKKGSQSMIAEPVGSENEPWLSISQVQDCELIHREIDKLPRLYREAIVVCHVQGHSRSEAAELLNKSEASIKSALSRGRNLLRRRLIRRGIMTTAILAAIEASNESAAAAVNESLIQSTIHTCSMSSTLDPTGPLSSIQTIANNGATMTTSLLTKSVLITAGLTLICLPLIVMAQTEDTPGLPPSAATHISVAHDSESISTPPNVQVTKSADTESKKQQAEAVDPRKFQIENSEEYWQLILQSLELRLQQQKTELNANRENFKTGLATNRQYELNSNSFETQAKIVEARLNIERIQYEKQSGAIIDSRRIPPASTAKLRPGEVLELKSLTDLTLSDPRVVVQADHTVTLALVGTISVKGKTPDELRKTLNEEYSQFIRDPNLFVRRYSAYDSQRSFER